MDNPQGNNLINDFSVVPALSFSGDKINGKIFASLVVATLQPYNPQELEKLVTVFKRVSNNFYYIRFYDNEEVYTQIGSDIRERSVELPSGKITDKILYARIDNQLNSAVIYGDGTLKIF